MTTPAPLVYGQHTTWPQPVQPLPVAWDAQPVQIAEITVDGTSVFTPRGTVDRRNARWFLGGPVPSHESTPSWATAAAILLAIPTCLLSLLLLLVKDTDVWSSTLSVTDGTVTHETTVYHRNPAQLQGIRDAIAWAQRVP